MGKSAFSYSLLLLIGGIFLLGASFVCGYFSYPPYELGLANASGALFVILSQAVSRIEALEDKVVALERAVREPGHSKP
ncbi:MAG: hypothetical protein JRN62_03705 [Nitrososphaerota archaeon]|jgi:hypothetical protein|nr:hypothetical protein [Nitrososphaerota archaeon]MDG6948707.1 hypothetical protein [Nitrososphaerota archaeon]